MMDDMILHRKDGPAVELSNGSKVWRVNGFLHRVEGPARENAGNSPEWWLHGYEFDESAHACLRHLSRRDLERHMVMRWRDRCKA